MERTAVLRAQWLAQILESIESAQSFAWQLRTDAETSQDARQLYDRLEALRVELSAVRGIAHVRELKIDPDWMQKLGLEGFPDASDLGD